jgi:hypothetical protein
VGYDRRSRIRAQKRVVKRQQESKTVNETTAKTCASKVNYFILLSYKNLYILYKY